MANTPNLFRSGAVGFIDLLGCASGLRIRLDGEAPPRDDLAVGPIRVPETGFERTLLIAVALGAAGAADVAIPSEDNAGGG